MTYEQLAARVTAAGETAGRWYALLVPVWEAAGELSLLFEVRSPSLHTQPGEVCFPGGGAEPGEGPQRTALRETAEELGLVPPMVELGPALPPVRRRAGEQIYPFLGRLCPGWREGLSLGKDEVAEVFSVPLSFFRDTPPEVYRCEQRTIPPADFPNERVGHPEGYPWKRGETTVLLWTWEGKVIWGLTARVVQSLVDLL